MGVGGVEECARFADRVETNRSRDRERERRGSQTRSAPLKMTPQEAIVDFHPLLWPRMRPWKTRLKNSPIVIV